MAIDRDRHDAILAALENSKIGALVCCAPTSVLLLTGYWPVLGASIAIFADDGQVMAIVPEDEVEIAESTSDARIIAYKPSSLEYLTSPVHEVAEPLSSAMASLRLPGKTIGTEMNQMMQPASYASTVVFHSSLIALLDSLQLTARVVPCDSILESLKSVKTAGELALIRKAADVAADGFYEVARHIKAGMRETEVAAMAHSAFETSRKARGIGRSYGFFYCMSGPNSAKACGAYARTRERVIEEGDLVMVHANTCADGYWTDITRTYVAGELTERHRAMRSAIWEARDEALKMIRPGIAATEIDRAARGVMEAHGFGSAFKHSTGHGVGFAAANANEIPRIHPKSTDILQERMTFNVEPAAYFEGYGGMRHCDLVAVTQSGVEVLTDF